MTSVPKKLNPSVFLGKAVFFDESAKEHTFAKFHPEEIERAKEHLNFGQTYKVREATISGWTIRFFLVDLPNVSFNSFMFKEA